MKSWPRKPKAAAVTEVARESIAAADIAISDRSTESSPIPSPPRSLKSSSIGLTKKVGGSTRSLPADVTMTPLNIASTNSQSMTNLSDTALDLSAKSDKHSRGEPSQPAKEPAKEVEKNQTPKESNEEEKPQNENGVSVENEVSAEDQAKYQTGWFSWISGTVYNAGAYGSNEDIGPKKANETPPESSSNEAAALESPIEQVQEQVNLNNDPTPAQKRSWLQMWTGNSTATGESNEPQPPNANATNEEEGQDGKPQPRPSDEPTDSQAPSNDSNPTQQSETKEETSKPPFGWMFWTKERQQLSDKLDNNSDPPDKTAPEHSVGNQETQYQEMETGPAKIKSKKITPNDKSFAMEVETPPSNVHIQADIRPPKSTPTPATKKAQQQLPNQVLPLFKETFPLESRPGLIQQIGRFMYGKGTQPKHVYRTREAPQLKKALAIGIHGYFPAPLLRTVIGQPTGTSIKFATMAGDAIRNWADTQGVQCEIENIALEGEGRIAERVDLLWKMLLNWIEQIREADLIMISCHSQGVPVATMLVSKLISFGCVSSARVGICAMAGVNLGPFHDYRSRWISGSAGELFDFANPISKVSQDYLDAMKTVLGFGVKITYVGSIDDQLVSLEVLKQSVVPFICHETLG